MEYFNCQLLQFIICFSYDWHLVYIKYSFLYSSEHDLYLKRLNYNRMFYWGRKPIPVQEAIQHSFPLVLSVHLVYVDVFSESRQTPGSNVVPCNILVTVAYDKPCMNVKSLEGRVIYFILKVKYIIMRHVIPCALYICLFLCKFLFFDL